MTMNKRIQISTTVNATTRRQAEWLMEQKGYTLRDVVTVSIDRLYREENTMNDRNEYFQHYAEVLSDELGTVTIVRIEGNDCLYEYDTGTDVFRGWWRDGEGLDDIKWQAVEQA